MRATIVAAACLLWLLPAGQASALRVEMIGHSATDGVNYGGFGQLAQSLGYTHIWNRHMVPGAPIWYIWSDREAGGGELPLGPSGYTLVRDPWDALVLSATGDMATDSVYVSKYMAMTQRRSPFAQVYIYTFNPAKDYLLPGTSLDAAGFDALANLRPAAGTPLTVRNGWKYTWEVLTQEARRQNRAMKPVLMVPTLQAMQEFNRRAALGQVPGYTCAWELFTDGAHMNNVGQYLFGCSIFAATYKEDPRVLGIPSAYGSIPDAVAQQIRESVWTAAFSHALTGVKTALEIIAHDTLPPAYDHVPYFTGFGATRPSVTFALASGSPPPGIALDGATGVLSGKPTATGSYTFTLSAEDQDAGTPTATLTRTITVSAAPAPVVVTTACESLDSAIIGCTYRMSLYSMYAYDTVHWSLAGGALPAGLSIADTTGCVHGIPATGAISGIPTQSGVFAFTVRATDGQSRSATRQLSLTVRPRPVNGLDGEYYKCDTLHGVYSYRNLQPSKVGIANTIWYTLRDDPVGYAIRLHGWLRVTQAGVHTFTNGADFVAVMTVNGRVINSGGGDSKMWHEASDTITLQPGYYRFEWLWYNRDGGWLGPGWKQPGDASTSGIPLASLFLDSAAVVPVTRAPGALHRSNLPARVRVFDLAGRRVGAPLSPQAGSHGGLSHGIYLAEPGAASRPVVVVR